MKWSTMNLDSEDFPFVEEKGGFGNPSDGKPKQNWKLSRVMGLIFIFSLAIVGTGLGLRAKACGAAEQLRRIQSIIIAQTGEPAAQVDRDQIVSGLYVNKATDSSARKAVDTFVQIGENSSVSIFAVLRKGQSAARFSGLLSDGERLEPAAGGGLSIIDANGRVERNVASPWARDATGKRLQTSYSVEGTDIVQRVATEDAVYPVVADPNVSTGLSGILPVYRIRFTWTETNKINVKLENDGIGAAAGVACGFIPVAPAKLVCGIVVVLVYGDLKSNIKSAIKNKKCLQIQVPVVSIPSSPLSGYDISTVKCSS